MKKHIRLLMQIILAVLFITNCNTPETTMPNTIVPTIKESAQPTNPPKPIKTPYPSRTPKSTLTSTSTPDFESPTFQLRNSKELQDFVVFNINQGKTITDINAFFGSSERKHVWVDGSVVDFDGDGVSELFLTTSFYPEDQDNIENSYVVLKKIQEQYSIVYSKSETAYHLPKIEFVDDLDSDNLPDLVFTRPTFGDDTGADIFVVREEKSGTNIIQIGETALIIDKIFSNTDNKDNAKNLVVIGFEPGWGSSGPGRTIEETYFISSEKYGLLQSSYLPDNYRIHVLQDAQIAYNSGNDDLAIKFWKQAAHDQTLENFPSTSIENDVPEKYQPAFAVYRLYTYFLSKNDIKNAQVYWTELNNRFPEGSPGGEFIALSAEAKRLLKISHDTSFVCGGIYEYLNSTTENVNFMMEHWYWGDHNLDIVDFCPLPR